ncbi:MAG: hypothetical protein P0116_15665, partial [Candidatus Nitrosocosmicus sp.]|nr:hypothetical protein [Candidatus Nitrosocosmicus sp.]
SIQNDLISEWAGSDLYCQRYKFEVCNSIWTTFISDEYVELEFRTIVGSGPKGLVLDILRV